MRYTIRKTVQTPLFRWEDFQSAETGFLTTPREQENASSPETEFRLLHDDCFIYGMFQVRETGLVSRHTRYLDMVCRDSCCEFFFQPDSCSGYFNLEMNAGGTYLMYFVRDPSRPDKPGTGYFKDYTPVDFRHGKLITVKTDQPAVIDPPVTERTLWHLMFTVPLEMLTFYCGEISGLSGREWKGNFYKCADCSPNPAWQAWAPLAGTDSFHTPQFFGTLIFE